MNLKKTLVTTLGTLAIVATGFMAQGATASADTKVTVQAGDSVWALAQKYDSSINAIEKANDIKGHLILPGQTLEIPNDTQAAAQTTTATQTTQTQQAAPAQNTQAATANTQASTGSTTSSSNAGTGSHAAILSQMESRTGVSASTWNTIIQRESNWQSQVRNSSSGAFGLFQNMHISGGSTQAQIDAAVKLYHQQGMGAWSM